jgi:1-acyl-sn-glycerol-3-phosphate acyltransferase
MFRVIGSTIYWCFVVLCSVVMFPLALLCWVVTFPFDRRKVALHRLTCFWASIYTWCNPIWPVEVVGRKKIDSNETYVMVANHQSLLDIFVMFRLFCHFKWVSKTENFRIPIIGWNMRLNEYIELKRGDNASITTMMQACRETLSAGNSIMMFPEGTRSFDGELRKFKPGAFDLAKTSRRPLLPIVVHGTASALPKKGLVFQGRHPIRIEVLDAIPYESFSDEPTEALTQRIRTLIRSHLQLKSEIPAAGV